MSKEDDIEQVMNELKQKGELTLNDIERMTPPGVPIFLMLHELRSQGCSCDGKWPVMGPGGLILGNVSVSKVYPPQED